MLSQNNIQGLSRNHIKYVLGIDIPLNESYQLTESDYKQIIEAQLLYESFFNSVKNWVEDKAKGAYNKVVRTIKDWVDSAVVLGKVLSSEQLLNNFSSHLWDKFTREKTGLVNELYEILDRIGLGNLKEGLKQLVVKIQQLSGWKKFMSATTVVTLTKYIISKIKSFPTEKIKEFIIKYLSNNAFSDILSKLKDFKSYLGWLEPIIGTVDAFRDALQPIIDKFANLPKPKIQASTQTENTIKKSPSMKVSLDQLMKGVDAEMEHEVSPSEALKIAVDHLKEDPKYYDKLKKAGLEEEDVEEYNEGEFCEECLKEYMIKHKDLLMEAEYQGRKVQLGKPMAGDVKKFKVYVKNSKGKVVKVNFGQKGVKIKKNNPKRRKSFRARHNCDNPGPRWKARYWSCRKW